MEFEIELTWFQQTNRLQCLRLTERCAMAIYSVRAEIADAERDMQSQQGQNGDVGVVGLAEEMEGPVRKLNECIEMVSFAVLQFCHGSSNHFVCPMLER